MNKSYIFYNPYAGNHKGRENAELLAVVYDNPVFCDITWMTGYEQIWEQMDESDQIILCGGDGTLNFFVNWIQERAVPAPIYFYSIGHGDDFVRDIGKRKGDTPYFCINDYIKNLPEITVNEERMQFVNGIYWGPASKKWNDITQQSTLDMVIRVDGETYRYENVWMISVTKGRYCNSGMLVAPEQDRLGSTLTIKIMHSSNKISRYQVYATMIKGKKIKFKNKVTIQDTLCKNEIRIA